MIFMDAAIADNRLLALLNPEICQFVFDLCRNESCVVTDLIDVEGPPSWNNHSIASFHF